MANQYLRGIDFGLEANVSTVAGAVNFHFVPRCMSVRGQGMNHNPVAHFVTSAIYCPGAAAIPPGRMIRSLPA
jgi:hypothetical protein